MEVPSTLRTWFAVHAAVDLVAAVPLLVAPAAALHPLGWACVDPATTRLVGAALLAIGVESWLMRGAGVEAYRVMLGFKVVWSLAACFALLAAIGAGAPPAAWAFLCTFIVFAGVWLHHAIRLRQMRLADALDDDGAHAGEAAPDEPSDR
jgi:hypothetical protein